MHPNSNCGDEFPVPLGQLDETRMRAGWQDRAPAMLKSLAGPDGEDVPTPFDRRWLWRLESFLFVSGTNDSQRAMSRDLREYLNETCQHVWREYEAEGDYPAHKQCLWCNDFVTKEETT